jgi:hypothetical protein
MKIYTSEQLEKDIALLTDGVKRLQDENAHLRLMMFRQKSLEAMAKCAVYDVASKCWVISERDLLDCSPTQEVPG